jgi:hypothetical protein
VYRHHSQERVDERRHHRPRRRGPGEFPAPVVRLPPSGTGWEGVEVSRGSAAAQHDHRQTEEASTILRWLQTDGGGHRQRLSQRVAGGATWLLAWKAQKSVHSGYYTVQSRLGPVGGVFCRPVPSHTP